MACGYFAEQRLEGGYLGEQGPLVGSLSEAIAWAVNRGDGLWEAGPQSPWGHVEGNDRETVTFEVKNRQIVTPELSDWEAIFSASCRESATRIPLLAVQREVWVVNHPRRGVSLCRKLSPGDTIVDVLTIRPSKAGLCVSSSRHGRPVERDGARYYESVSIFGRAGGWGSLGDDSYDDETAKDLLADTLWEAFHRTSDWSYARIYYEVVETSEQPEDLEIKIEAKWYDLRVFPLIQLAALGREEAARASKILGGSQ